MEGQTQTFVYNSPPQENQQTNPMVKSRQPTDKLFIFVFLLITVAWLGVGISGFCAHQREYNSHQSHVDYATIFKALANAPAIRFSFVFIMMIVLGSCMSYCCIILDKTHTNFCVYFGVGLYILYEIYESAEAFGLKSRPPIVNDLFKGIPPQFMIASQLLCCLNIIFLILSVFSLLIVEKNSMLNIIKDVCGFVLGNPLIIVFTVLICLLEYAVFSFSINAVLFETSSYRSVYHVVFDSLVIILGGMCAFTFLFNFALMVVSEHSVNYYWKNRVSIIESIVQVSRNHLGTIMFSSLSPLFVPYICAIYQALKHKRTWKNNENYFFYFANKAYLTLSMPYFALFYSSIYGNGLIKSMQKTFDTVLRHSVLCLATVGVFDALLNTIFNGLMILGAIGVISSLGTGVKNFENIDIHSPEGLEVAIEFFIAMYGTMFPYTIFYSVVYYSGRALLLNKIIILNNENQYTEGKAEILNRL